MTAFDHNMLAKLMAQIAIDLETATSFASAAAASANNDAEAGRISAAFERILDAEPQIHQARTLVSIAAYVAELDRNGRSDKAWPSPSERRS